MTRSPSYRCRRSISAAAKPAAPPPTITIRSGAGGCWAPLFPVAGAGCFFRFTKIFPPLCSTAQQETGLMAGAERASPVRRLKHA